METYSERRLIKENFTVVLLMYLIKSAAKLAVGLHSHSAALITDGIHNIYDIFQFFGINIAFRMSRKKDLEKYPLGKAPLESIVSIAIATTLITLGLGFLTTGLRKALNILGIPDWLTNVAPFNIDFLINSIVLEDVSLPVVSWLIIFTVLGSALLSLIVYKYEIKIAETVKSKSLESDAIELRSDMYLELSLSLGFILAKLFQLSWVDSVFSIAISGLVIHSGCSLFKENALDLLNRAISSEDRKRITDILESIEGVVADDPETHINIRAYTACKNRIRVEGVLPIKAVSSDDTSLILRIAESKVRSVLGSKYGDIDVFLKPRIVAKIDVDEHLEGIIDEYLRTVWSIDSRANENIKILLTDFVKADYRGAIDQASRMIQDEGRMARTIHSKETLLSEYFLAVSYLRHNGPFAEDTQKAFQAIKERTVRSDLDENIVAAMKIALGDYQLEYLIREEYAEGIDIRRTRASLKGVFDNDSLPSTLRAEAAHILARSYYRISGYDLNRAREWFRRSRESYLSARRLYTPLFKDKVLTDWGNFEAQFYNLEPAKEYLEEAGTLKEGKGDRHGLAMIYGCLGSTFSRAGEFERAREYFDKDLKGIEELKITHEIPHVQCKIGDLSIKQALLNGNEELLDEAINLLSSAQEIDPNNYFVQKGLVKAYFGKWWLNPELAGNLEIAQKTNDKIGEMLRDSRNQYKMAIHNRLAGRIEGAKLNWDKARSFLNASARCFTGLGLKEDLPIQAILSGIEELRWSAFSEKGNWVAMLEKRLDEMRNEFRKVGMGMSEYINPLNSSALKRMRKKCLRISQEKLQPQELSKRLSEILSPLDRLIWFLEI